MLLQLEIDPKCYGTTWVSLNYLKLSAHHNQFGVQNNQDDLSPYQTQQSWPFQRVDLGLCIVLKQKNNLSTDRASLWKSLTYISPK